MRFLESSRTAQNRSLAYLPEATDLSHADQATLAFLATLREPLGRQGGKCVCIRRASE